MTTLVSTSVASIFTSADQQNIELRPLASGGFIAVWTSFEQSGSGLGLVGQIFNEFGERVGGEIQIETKTNGAQSEHDVVGLSGGGFVVTWRDASSNTIRMQQFDGTGQPIGTETVVAVTTFSTINQPTVTAMSDGGFVIAWTNYNNTTFTQDIYAQRYDDMGQAVGGGVALTPTSSVFETFADIEALGTGYVAVWLSNTTGSNPRVGIFAADGTVTVPTFDVPSTTGLTGSDPQVTVLSGGRFVVTWTTSSGDSSGAAVQARIFNADGTPVAAQFQVNITTLGTQNQPAIIATADGGFAIAYYSDYNATAFVSELLMRRFDSDGVPDSAGEVQVTTTAANSPNQPSIVELANGMIVVGYDRFDATDSSHNVFINRLLPEGSTVVVPQAPEVDGVTRSLTLTEAEINAGPVVLDSAVAVSDADTAAFSGGRLILQRISEEDDNNIYQQGFQDNLGVRNVGNAAGQIGVSGSTVSLGGVQIGVILQDGQNGNDLIISLNSNATPDAVEALIESLTYQSDSDNPDGTVELALLLEDGSGATSAPSVITLNITEEFDARQPQASGPETVNSTTEGSQTFSGVAALSGGGWVTVWRSEGQDGSSGGIFGQVFDANGAQLGREFQINSDFAGNQTTPTVAAFNAGPNVGGFIVLWDNDGAPFVQGQMTAQIFDASGAPVGPEFTAVSNATTFTEYDPDVTTLADGSFVITWVTYESSAADYLVKARHFDASGAPTGAEFTVNPLVSGQSFDPKVAQLANGNLVFSWTDTSGDADGVGVQAAIFTPAGVAVLPAFVATTATQSTQDRSAVAALDGGGFVIAWTDAIADGSSTGVFAQRFADNGTPIGTQFLVNESTSNGQLNPDVIGLPGGGFMIAWDGFSPTTGSFAVFVQSYDSNGNRLDGETQLASGPEWQSDISLGLLANGDVIATFTTNNDGSSNGIQQIVLGSAGNYGGASADPVIGGLNLTRTLTEAEVNAGAALLDADGNVSVVDLDSTNFDGGRLEIARLVQFSNENRFPAPDGLEQDILGIQNQGTGAGQIGVSGSNVTFEGTVIGSLAVEPGYLRVTFNASATAEAAQTLLGAITYTNPSDDPVDVRELRVRLTDGDGGESQPLVVTLDITPEIEAPGFATDERFVNSFQTNTQEDSSVAALSDGGYVIVWESLDQDAPSTWGIYGQRYDANGGRVGGEILINTTVAGSQNDPEVVGLTGGGFAVVWRGSASDGASHFLRGQVYDVNGASVGGEFVVEGSSGFDGRQPHLIALDTGGFAVAYSGRQADFLGNVFLTTFGPTGGPALAEVPVSATANQGETEIDLDQLSNGNLVVTFRQSGVDFTTDVFARIYSPALVPITGEFQVNTSLTSSQTDPRVAALTTGGFVVTWTTQDSDADGSSFAVMAQRFDASGNPVGEEFLVNEPSISAQYESDVIGLDGGAFAIIYRDDSGSDGSGSGVLVQFYNGDGGRVDDPISVSMTGNGTQSGGSLAVLAGGAVVTAWNEASQQNGFVNDILHRVLGNPADFVSLQTNPVISDVDNLIVPTATAGTARLLDDGVQVSDADSADFDGGLLSLTWANHRADAFEQLGFTSGGRVSLTGSDVFVDGVQIGTIRAAADGQNGSDLLIDLVAGATPETVRVLLENVTYLNSNATVTTGERELVIGLTDGDGGTADPIAVTVQIGSFSLTNISLTNVVTTRVFDESDAQSLSGVAIDTAVDFDYSGAAGLSGGRVEFTFSTTAAFRDGGSLDELFIQDQGTGAGQISVSGSTISFGGTAFATINGVLNGTAGQNLQIDFGAAATEAAVDALIEALRYRNPLDGIEQDRILRINVFDNGGQNTGQRSVTLVNTPQDDGGIRPEGTESQVNSFVTSQQYQPDVFSLNDGGFIVVWSSFGQDSPSNYGVFGQRYDSDGAPIGPEFLVNPRSAASQDDASGVGLQSGGWAITWVDSGADGSGLGVYARIYGSDGSAGADFLVNQQTSSNQSEPEIVQLSNGNLLFTWTAVTSAGSGDGSSNGITGRIFSSAGTALGNDFVINPTITGSQTQSDIAADSSGGFVAVWAGPDASGEGVHFQRYDSAGARVGGEVAVNTTTASTQSNPSVARLLDGGFVITWEDNSGVDGSGSGVFQQRYDSAGVPVGGEELVNQGTTNSQFDSSVTPLPDGGWLVTWSSNSFIFETSGLGIVGQQFAPDGSRVDGEFLINQRQSGNQSDSVTATLSDGRVVVVWVSDTSGTSGDGSSSGIFVRLLGDGVIPAGAENPVLEGLPETVSLAEAEVNAGPVAIFAGRSVISDADSANFDGGRLEVSRPSFSSVSDLFSAPDNQQQDNLSFASSRVSVTGTNVSVEGVVIGSLTSDGQNGSSLSVVFNANATAARIEALLDALSYSSPSDDPDFSRDLRIVLSDGDGGHVSHSITLEITPETETVGPATNEAIVNSETVQAQNNAVSAALANGGYVTIWTSFSQDFALDGGSGVFGQLYNSDGQPIGAEFRVNETVQGNQSTPSVIALANGNFVVGWDGSGIGDGSGVFGRIFDQNATPAGGEFRLNDNTSGTENEVELAAGSSGNFMAVWSDSNGDGSGFGIRGRLYDQDGAATSVEFGINTFTNSTQSLPSVTELAGGGWVVTWTSFGQDSSSNGVFGQRFTATGVPIGAEFGVNTTTSQSQTNSQVVGLTGGGFVVVWEDQSGADGSGIGIFGQIYNASGMRVGGEFLVNEFVIGSDFQPVVAATDDGGFIVGFTSGASPVDPFSNGAFIQFYDATGARLDGQQLANETVSGNQTLTDITVLPNGILMNYTSTDGSGDGVFQRIFGDPADFDRANSPELDAINPTRTVAESAVNIAPVRIDLNGAAVVRDPDGSGWNTGFIRVDVLESDTEALSQYLSPDDESQDQIGLLLENGISISGTTVSVNGTAVGSITSTGVDGQPFIISLNGNADTASVEILIENLSYRNVSNDPDETRLIRIQLGDADGQLSDPVIVSMTVTPSLDGALPDFGERQANTFVTSNQDAPNVARIDGGFVMVWQSTGQDAAGSLGIYGQRFDNEGNAVGAEFVVNTTTTGNQLDGHVAGLPGGGFVVTWTGVDSSAQGIYMQRFAADGSLVGTETLVNTFETSTQADASVTVLDDGNILVTWSSFGNSIAGANGYDIYYRVFDGTTGAALTSEARANLETSSTQDISTVTALPGGGFVIGWMSVTSGTAGDGDSNGTFARTFTPDGAGGYTSPASEIQLNIFEAGAQDTVALTTLANGNIVAVWESDNQDGSGTGIFSRILGPDGSPVTEEFRVNEIRVVSQFTPQVAALENGGFVVVFADNSGTDGSGTGVFAQQFDAQGNRIDAPLQVNTEFSSSQFEPTVAPLAGGGFVVGWTSATSGTAGDGSGNGVFYQIFANDPPVVQNVVANAIEDTTFVFDATLFSSGFTDPEGEPLAAIRIDVLPAAGQLFLNNVAVAPGTEINVTALDAGALTYVPNANANGLDSFGWSGSDGNSFSSINALTQINVAPVNDPVDLEAGPNTVIAEGGNLSRNLTLVDPDNDIWTITVDYGDGDAPQTFNSSNATFGLFNSYPDEGTYTVTVTVSDNNGSSASDSFDVTVENAAPVARTDSFSGNEDNVISGNILASNGFGPDFDPGSDPIDVISVNGASFSAGIPFTLPSGATLTLAADGTMSYDPSTSAALQSLAGGQMGTDSFTYTIEDDAGLTSSSTVNFSISGLDDNVVAQDDQFEVDEDSTITTASVFADNGNGIDFDPEGDSISVISINGNAAFVGAPVVLSGGGVLTIGSNGQLTFNTNGGYQSLGVGESQVVTFTYIVQESGAALTASAMGSISILGVNDDPVAVADSAGTNFNTAVSGIAVLGNDFDLDGDTLQVTGFSQASNGTVVETASGVFSYTPNSGFFGSDSFTYTISDGNGGTDTGTVSVTVNGPSNSSPVAVADSYAVDEDNVLTVGVAAGVLANDSDVDGDPLTVSLLTGPANGSLTLNADGSFDYTPDANFNGADSFTYEVSDGNGGTATATASITVNAVNDDPTAVADSGFTTPFETALSIAPATLLANDTDVDGDTLSVTAVGNAVGGTVALVAGQVVFTPTSGFSGPASFTYDISDGNGGTDTASVSLTVQGGGGLTGIIGTAGDDVFNARTTAPGQALPTSAAEVIHGLGGNDRIDGVGGADTMYGGAGDDVYFLRSAGAIASETDPLTGLDSGGEDRVFSFVDTVLGNFVENLSLAGTAVSGTGNALDNVLYGNAQDNVLVGLDGNDVLNGLVGGDTMEGGNGDDVYFVDDVGDMVVELPGQGDDRVNSAIDYVLTDGVERLNLTRTAVSGTGNDLDNIMHGNAEDNILDGSSGHDRIFGNAGNDTIIGGEGMDTVTGGAGSDVFVFSSISDAGDRLNDFASGVDQIELDLAGFVDLAGLALADAFIFGSEALDSDDRLIYDQSSSTLYYDADGAGGADQTLLANLNFGATLLHTDFLLT